MIDVHINADPISKDPVTQIHLFDRDKVIVIRFCWKCKLIWQAGKAIHSVIRCDR